MNQAGIFYNSNKGYDTPELVIVVMETGNILTGHDEALKAEELEAAEYRAHLLMCGMTKMPEHLKDKYQLRAIRFEHHEHGQYTTYYLNELRLEGGRVKSRFTTSGLEWKELLEVRKEYPLPERIARFKDDSYSGREEEIAREKIENLLQLEVWVTIFLNYGFYEALPFMSFCL